MTIIDEYIFLNHRNMSNEDMAERIGVSKYFVASRKIELEKLPKVTSNPITLGDEISALIHLIEVRKIGWAVDVAKRRIQDIQTMLNHQNQ